jgi:hypothetical protein
MFVCIDVLCIYICNVVYMCQCIGALVCMYYVNMYVCKYAVFMRLCVYIRAHVHVYV